MPKSAPFVTPVGRIVWGNPLKPRPKMDQNVSPPVPVLKDGKQVQQWAFGLAIPKAEFNAQVWPQMAAAAAATFGATVPQNFRYKLIDGDGMDTNNPPKPYRDREGYAGHVVLVISTEAFQPPLFKYDPQSRNYMQWTELKTGDYVRANITLEAHQGKAGIRTSVPGMYVNPVGVEFIGYGTEINNGPDAMTMFGGQHVALPPGASATPLAPAGAPIMPGGPPGYAPPAPSFGAPAATPPGYPSQAPAPGYGAAPSPLPGYPPIAPAAAPPGMQPVGYPQPMLGVAPGYPPAAPPTAYPSSVPPLAPAYDWAAGAPGQQPPGVTPAPGQRIVGYNPQTGMPIYG